MHFLKRDNPKFTKATLTNDATEITNCISSFYSLKNTIKQTKRPIRKVPPHIQTELELELMKRILKDLLDISKIIFNNDNDFMEQENSKGITRN